jgi:hypothetical protein
MPLACLGSAEARHELTPRRQRFQIKIIRIRINMIWRPAMGRRHWLSSMRRYGRVADCAALETHGIRLYELPRSTGTRL